MSAIILDCSPAECEKIANGDISILVRKVVPKETPFKVYIYGMHKAKIVKHYRYEGKSRIIGEFICNKVGKYEPHVILCACYEVNGADVKENLRYNKGTCLSYEEMVKKSNGKPLYGLHISDLKIYDEPKALSCFYKQCPKNTTCSTCDWFHVDWHTFGECSNTITRPPKNYIYVEE